jgi:hypothetical protein
MTTMLLPLRRYPWAVLTVACAALAAGAIGLLWQVASDQPHPYYDVVSHIVFVLGYGVVGAFLTDRVPTNDTGPWMLLSALFVGFQSALGVLALTVGSGGALVAVVGGLFALCRLLGMSGALVVMLLLAPTGRPLSRRWAGFIRVWAVIVMLGAVAVFLGGPGSDLGGYPTDTSLLPESLYGLYWFYIFTNWFLLVGLVAGIVCLVLRVRRARGVERQQVLWVVVAGVAGPALIAVVTLGAKVLDLPRTGAMGLLTTSLAALCLPAGIAVAVTRHGLYDLGRLVSRTVTYAVVTGLVLAIYAVTVTLLTKLVPASSSFAVAAATLAAAGVAQPILRRVRRVIDRRFDRAHYDASRVVEQFGNGLRSSVDTGEISVQLMDVLRRTVLPRSARLTLFEAGRDTAG